MLAGRYLAAQAEGLLEEGAPAAMVAEDAGDAEFQPAAVGERGAMAAVRRSFEKREKRLEELFGNRWNAMGCIGHENFLAKGCEVNPEWSGKAASRDRHEAGG